MATPAPGPSPQPLAAATRGFVQLATWFTGLAGAHAADVAQRIDEDRFDATAAVARAAVLPILGWTAFLNEVLDAAGVILHPPQKVRQAESPDFALPPTWDRDRALALSPLVNGFGEALPEGVVVTLDPATVAEGRKVRLKATNIPHEAVGVYVGTVAPVGTAEGDTGPVTVWLVVP